MEHPYDKRVRVSHPTDRPNFSIVEIGRLSLAFSYETVIGFWTPFSPDGSGGWTVTRNYWGPTTGKALNFLDNGKKGDRLGEEDFSRALEKVLSPLWEGLGQ